MNLQNKLVLDESAKHMVVFLQINVLSACNVI